MKILFIFLFLSSIAGKELLPDIMGIELEKMDLLEKTNKDNSQKEGKEGKDSIEDDKVVNDEHFDDAKYSFGINYFVQNLKNCILNHKNPFIEKHILPPEIK